MERHPKLLKQSMARVFPAGSIRGDASRPEKDAASETGPTELSTGQFGFGSAEMFKWLRELTKTERVTLSACFAGWTVDALDTQVYSFLIPTLISIWSMTKAEAGLLGTCSLISSSLGGWIAGILCDRIGRARVMKLAIIWFTVFTVLSGLTDSYAQLFVARVLSGVGFGGEWAAGSVLMGEMIRPQHRGKAVSTVQSAYAIGFGLAAVLSSLMFAQFSETMAWRALFIVGAAPGVIVLLLMRGVREPEVFLKAKREKAATGAANVTPWAIFHPKILRTTILASVLALGIQGAGFSLNVWMPTYLATVRKISHVDLGYLYVALNVGGFFGYIAAGYICDAIGRRRNFLLFVVLCWVTQAFFLYVPVRREIEYVVLFSTGFSTFGIYGALGPFFTELFPTAIRANAQAFAYNIGRGLGALFPFAIGLILTGNYLPFREAIATCYLGNYLFVIVAVALLPETKGRELSEGTQL